MTPAADGPMAVEPVRARPEGGVETVLSCLRSTDFGPVMTLGLGGMGIELFRDVVHFALPADPAWIREAIGKLKRWTLLEGFRGAPQADVDALVVAAVSFGDLFLAMPEVEEFEVNRCWCYRRGRGSWRSMRW